MVPDRQKMRSDGRNGRTDAAKTISLRLRQGIIIGNGHFPVFVVLLLYVPKSTAMVMAGRSVHLTTLFFLGELKQAVNQYLVHILLPIADNNPS